MCFQVEAAIADTMGAAWALARFGKKKIVRQGSCFICYPRFVCDWRKAIVRQGDLHSCAFVWTTVSPQYWCVLLNRHDPSYI